MPQGTPLELVFDEHKFQDAYWFVTGGQYDSPYGEWRDGASPPTTLSCEQKDFAGAIRGITGGKLNRVGDIYVPLVVDPPAKTITGTSSLTCGSPTANGSLSCRAVTPGRVPLEFVFAATTGKFYARVSPKTTNPIGQIGGCYGTNNSMTVVARGGHVTDSGPTSLTVPQRFIDYPITIVAAPKNPDAHTPSTPSLSSAGACVVGQPHSIAFSATEPDGDDIRYGIDWDANGSIDQWAPPSGYVASGQSQTASRTYSLAGEKMVKVMAQDEGALSSAWAILSFTCTDTTTASLNENGGANDTGTGQTFLPPAADLDLRAIPSLVKSGDTTNINWSSAGMQTCAVTGDNGDAWTGTQSPIGGETSSPIIGETTYTLSCLDPDGATHTKRTTVRILPTFQEL